MTNYDYTYLGIQKRKKLPLFLQLAYVVVGLLLILAFIIFFTDRREETSASLFSPIVNQEERETKKEYSYKLLWADPKNLIYKESQNRNQTLKILIPSTNLTKSIVTGKRVGFIDFLKEDTLLFLEDKEGLGRFTINEYDISKDEVSPYLSFAAFSQIPESELDQLVSLSPDKTRLAVVHESGIVIYTIRHEKETTILENNPKYSFRKPTWIGSELLLIYQIEETKETPLIVTADGTLQAVLPASFTSLSPCFKNGNLSLPLIGTTASGLHLVDAEKTTLLRETPVNTEFRETLWLSENMIIAFANVSSVPTVVRIDSQGKKMVTLIEFSNTTLLSDLTADPARQNIYFLTSQKGNSNIKVNFYKMGIKEDKPISFYSIAKNL